MAGSALCTLKAVSAEHWAQQNESSEMGIFVLDTYGLHTTRSRAPRRQSWLVPGRPAPPGEPGHALLDRVRLEEGGRLDPRVQPELVSRPRGQGPWPCSHLLRRRRGVVYSVCPTPTAERRGPAAAEPGSAQGPRVPPRRHPPPRACPVSPPCPPPPARNRNALTGRVPPKRALLRSAPTRLQGVAGALESPRPITNTFDVSFLSRPARSCQAFWGAILSGSGV